MVEKLYSYMAAGHKLESLLPLLEGMEVIGIGALQNIERQGEGFNDYLKEMRNMCEIANVIGAKRIQICTGPSDVNTVQDFMDGKLSADDPRYKGLLGASEEELLEKTAINVAAGADIAAEYGIDLYMEPLAWVPLGKIEQALKVIKMAGKKNVGVVIDFWHMWTTNETPEFVASIDKDLIQLVHICDGIAFDGKGAANQDILRDVWTGEGDIPLKRWIDAVRQTGFDGWFSTEIFSKKIYERDIRETAGLLKKNFEYMLGL